MRIRDKIITAACRTGDGIEWTSLKIKPDGNELVEQSAMALSLPDDISEESLSSTPLPAELADHLNGDLTVAMRTSELLMRSMKFPTPDPLEISEMVGFQIDKVSPYPVDQLAVGHEILDSDAESADVLMVASKRERVDAIGDVFEGKGIRIHSIDARILGWLELLRAGNHISSKGCELLIVDDGIDFALAVLNNSKPLSFRSLHTDLQNMDVLEELIHEIGYTLTTLDVEHQLPAPDAIQIWSFDSVATQLQSKLGEKTGLKVKHHDLAVLPPLSQGIIDRALNADHRIELIPREWVEHQKRKEMQRKFSIIAGGIAAVWLFVLLVFFSVYKVRDIRLAHISEDAEEIRPTAQLALQNRQKLKALQVYADRSDSSLESLREITQLLPVGDIEFVSFNYTKGKGVTIRGTARSDDLVNDFFSSLNKSALFDGTKDVSTSAKTSKGVRRTVFSVTLPFPKKENG